MFSRSRGSGRHAKVDKADDARLDAAGARDAFASTGAVHDLARAEALLRAL